LGSPAKAWYVPAAQSVQLLMRTAEYLPATQEVQPEAPAAAKEPAPHSLQLFAIAPTEDMEVPASHDTQVPLPAAVW